MGDEKDEQNFLKTALDFAGKYVLLPVMTALLAWVFSTSQADRSIDKSMKKTADRYETLASSINDHINRQLDSHEARLDVLEKASSSQPFRIERIILPSASHDPYNDLRRDVNGYVRERRVTARMPMKASVTVRPASVPAPTKAPVMAPPHRVPPPAPVTLPPPAPRVPERF